MFLKVNWEEDIIWNGEEIKHKVRNRGAAISTTSKNTAAVFLAKSVKMPCTHLIIYKLSEAQLLYDYIDVTDLLRHSLTDI